MAGLCPTLPWMYKGKITVMVPAQDLVPCGSWDVEKEQPEGPPRLDLQLWRGQTGKLADKQPRAETP